jgi:hypothetical protein
VKDSTFFDPVVLLELSDVRLRGNEDEDEDEDGCATRGG